MAISVSIDMRASISKRWQGVLSFMNNYKKSAASFIWFESAFLAREMREEYKKVYNSNSGNLLKALVVVPKNRSKVKLGGKTISVHIGDNRYLNMRPPRMIGGKAIDSVPYGSDYSPKTVAQYMEYLDTGRGASAKTIYSRRQAIRIPKEYFESGLYPKSAAILANWMGQTQKSRIPKLSEMPSKKEMTDNPLKKYYKSTAKSSSGINYAQNMEKLLRKRMAAYDKYKGILLLWVNHSRRKGAGNFISGPITRFRASAGDRFFKFIDNTVKYYMGEASTSTPGVSMPMRATHSEVKILLNSASARSRAANVIRGKVK